MVYADAGYTGIEKREEIITAKEVGAIRADLEWKVATKRGVITKMAEGVLRELTILMERKKAQVRARVEHPFHVVKNLFHHKKARYKGLAKNAAQMFSLFGLVNLVIAKKSLLAIDGTGAT